MAVVGETGTLKACLPGRTDVDDISAKTGTLNDVTALSGLRVADNGDVLTFAMLANGEGVGITLLTCDIGEVENEIQLARRYYNGTARDMNVLVESFPSNFVAGFFSFDKAKFFEIENPEDRAVPKVTFDG